MSGIEQPDLSYSVEEETPVNGIDAPLSVTPSALASQNHLEEEETILTDLEPGESELLMRLTRVQSGTP